jgi:hypothetical protein
MNPAELFNLIRAHLDILEASSQAGPTSIATGDVVQLKPDADPTFGGTLLRVTRATTWHIEGYLLVPHRGGQPEAWRRFPPSSLSTIGALIYPESAWGFRPYGALPCKSVHSATSRLASPLTAARSA